MFRDYPVSKLVLIVAFSFFGMAASAQESDIRVMSFNIRYGTAKDGENHWDKRKANVLTTIKEFQPDFLGTQETLGFQAEFLKSGLPDFLYVGRSRENNNRGEQCGILVRKERFDVLEQGHFWLSETPNVPASKSWDSSLPRMATWVKVFDRKSKSVYYFVNTHFDHRGRVARERSAQLLVERTSTFEQGIPVVLTGDFNAGTDSKPYKHLTAAFTDTFGSLHPEAKQTGTFSAFNGKKNGPRIDFVFVAKGLGVVSAAIDHREFDGRNPSDHFPVTAVLRPSK